MHPRKPHLLHRRRAARRLLPDRGGVGGALLVEGQGLEGVRDVVVEGGVEELVLPEEVRKAELLE
jgi:hypothetical protein